VDTNQKEIKHQGVIRQITDDFYFVSVERTAACHGCAAKGFCNISTNKSELIPVQRLPHQNFSTGDEVTLSLTEKMGWKALFYGYGLPFLSLIVGIIVASAAGLPQGAIGLVGIGLLAIYYVVFSIFRKKIDRQFSLKIMDCRLN
jgi:sigma-E factor negative regulatory protein RseC